MKIEINNEIYDIVIDKKVTTKNLYIRVKEDLKIYITTNKFTSNKSIIEVINKNTKSIERMINKVKKEKENSDNFYYLGKKYDIVYINNETVKLGDGKIFINYNYDINKWLKKEASVIFKEELDKIYKTFPYKIPYPSLTIRSMKTRWGVCNTRDKRITLNLLLIRKDKIYLDYVIVHELSHLIHPNHSKLFWNVVEEVMPESKKIRKELKNNE